MSVTGIATSSIFMSTDQVYPGPERASPRYGITPFGTVPIRHQPVWFGPVTAVSFLVVAAIVMAVG
jgi:hypothetical protein